MAPALDSCRTVALKVDGDPLLADAAWAGAKCNMLTKPKVETDQRKTNQRDGSSFINAYL